MMTTYTTEDQQYEIFENLIKSRIAAHSGPLFTTNVNPDLMWIAYLNSLPRNRQYYNCNCCRRFIQQFGGLVTLSIGGVYMQPLLWKPDDPEVPEFFRTAATQLWSLVKLSTVSGVFLSKESQLGTAMTRVDTKDGNGNPYSYHTWTHLCGILSKPFSHPLLSASQAIAEKLEEYKLMQRTVDTIDRQVLKSANQILQQGGLYRSEKAVAIAEWLTTVLASVDMLTGEERSRVLWYTVATAPTGFCHVKNTVLGTLLEDIEKGLSFSVVAERWKEKLYPMQYQRPTAAPTVGNIERAEKIFSEMGLENSLKRRYALLSEIPSDVIIWKPTAVESSERIPKPGLFSGILPKSSTLPIILVPATMTWAKFSRDVLPSVSKMQLRVPDYGGFYGLATAVDLEAPPILQWDRPERRNPFSHYFYDRGSSRQSWGLGTKAEVTAIFESPANWYSPKSHHGDKLFFSLERCRDSRSPGLCIFPETLRSELREVRATIERYSKTQQLQQPQSASAFGDQQANGICNFPVTVEVTSTAGSQTITIDRLE